jgi:hypothetical protein
MPYNLLKGSWIMINDDLVWLKREIFLRFRKIDIFHHASEQVVLDQMMMEKSDLHGNDGNPGAPLTGSCPDKETGAALE